MPLRDLIAPFTSSRTLGHVAMLAVAMGVYALLPVAKEYSPYREIGDTPSELHAALSLTMVTSYFMLGMEIVAEHVEEPFGLDEDDLDLDGLCNTIESSVKDVLGRRESPEES